MRVKKDKAQKLREIVDAYVFSLQDESNAPKISEAKNVVDALKKQFEAFQAALNAEPLSVRNEIDEHIEDYLAKRNRFELRRVGEPQNRSEIGLRGPRLSVIAELAGELVVACEYARAKLTEHEGRDYYRLGEAWGDFIRALAGCWEATTGKRATASKSRKSRRKQSPFVVFAFSIQRLLPAMFRQHLGGKKSVDYPHPPASFGEAVANELRQKR